MKEDTAVEENFINISGDDSKKEKKLKKSKNISTTDNSGDDGKKKKKLKKSKDILTTDNSEDDSKKKKNLKKSKDVSTTKGKDGVQGGGKGVEINEESGHEVEKNLKSNDKMVFTEKPIKIKKTRRIRPLVWSNEKLEVTEELSKQICGRDNERNSRSLYVRFPSTLQVRNVFDVTKYLGEVIADGVMRLSTSKRNSTYGFGYVEFKNEAIAKKKIEEINQVEVDGVKFYAEAPKPLSDVDLDPTRLHVSNLPEGTTRMDLRNVFSTSNRIDYPKQKKIKSLRNYAFITFKTKEEALMVFNNTGKFQVNGKEVTITFAKLKLGRGMKNDAKKVDNKPSEKIGKRKKFKQSSDADVSAPPTKKMKVKEDTEIKETNSDADEMEVKETDDVSEDQVGDDDDEGDDDDDDMEDDE